MNQPPPLREITQEHVAIPRISVRRRYPRTRSVAFHREVGNHLLRVAPIQDTVSRCSRYTPIPMARAANGSCHFRVPRRSALPVSPTVVWMAVRSRDRKAFVGSGLWQCGVSRSRRLQGCLGGALAQLRVASSSLVDARGSGPPRRESGRHDARLSRLAFIEVTTAFHERCDPGSSDGEQHYRLGYRLVSRIPRLNAKKRGTMR